MLLSRIGDILFSSTIVSSSSSPSIKKEKEIFKAVDIFQRVETVGLDFPYNHTPYLLFTLKNNSLEKKIQHKKIVILK